MSRRSVLEVGLTAAIVALAALMFGAVGPASARTRAQAMHAHPVVGPPVGHAKPATSAPNLAPDQASPWTPLVNAPPAPPGTMLLAPDGTVYVHVEPSSGGTAYWERLTPDSHGNYVDGTWSALPPMPNGYNPLYFASAILPDGRLIVEGGEYLGGTPTWTNEGAIYNPYTNSWKSVAPPAGWNNIGDAESDVLANGTFMLAQACQNCTSSSGTLSTAYALFNATALSWTPQSGQGKNDPNDEEGWTLDQNNQLLTVDTWLTPTTEYFNPTNLTWNFAGNTPTSPVNPYAVEIGPQVEMPNGNVFVVGAGSSDEEAPAPCTTNTPAATALYNNALGRWQAGPPIPTINGQQYDSADGPGTVLPDGNVLFDASPCIFNAPLAFFKYNASSNSLSAVPDIPNAANDSTYYTRLLVLPNGQILFNDGSNQMLVYTDDNTPNPAWAPSVTSISSTTYSPGGTYSLSGTQLSGLDQGAAYGDDVQDNTNFPLVRITNSSTGVVTYARTEFWSNASVAPGATSSTYFTVPAGTPAGASTLQVVANGIASSPIPVTVS